MKLSEDLKQCHESGDFGKALDGYSERAEALEVDFDKARNQGKNDMCDQMTKSLRGVIERNGNINMKASQVLQLYVQAKRGELE